MNAKPLIMVCMLIGSTVGSYVPSLWGVGWLSFTSVLFSGIGGLVGIWVGFKLSR